jgi:hypothetical protein
MTVSTRAPAQSYDRPTSRLREDWWALRVVLASSISIVVGLIWDISWHRTIGRDTFWSPPHLLEQIAAAAAGIGCGWLVLRTTFAGTEEARARSVRFWGFRGPLGAWVCIWGSLMMILSAPFDDWWHNAYGLDVRIISPPHVILAVGIVAIQVGAMLMALAAQNRAHEDETKRLGIVYALSAGILLAMHATVIMEYASFGNHMHGSTFYRVTALGIPAILVATGRASRLRWPATTTAAIYMVIVLAMLWTLQLFPAQPKLAPIFNPVTRMVPPPFPLLVIVPAVAIDLLMRRVRGHDWWLSLMTGVLYVAVMLAVHWFFAEFLLSPLARNFVFGVDHWDYAERLGPWRYQYWNLDRDALGTPSLRVFVRGLMIAVATAIGSVRVGLWWGSGMRRVQR